MQAQTVHVHDATHAGARIGNTQSSIYGRDFTLLPATFFAHVLLVVGY